MAYKIGFVKETDKEREDNLQPKVMQKEIVARKSVVQVYFADRNQSYSYYNDQFHLKQGDLVYVEGKLEGLRGRVTEVNYTFKIKVSDYKRVIAVADTDVRGEFYMAGSHFVTFDRSTLPKEKILTWFRAPVQEEEFISGWDDTCFSLDRLADMKVDERIAERGHEYYFKNQVRYLCMDHGRGYAIVEGSEAYEVEFQYKNHEISHLVCSCFCSFNCKHEFATMLQLRETLAFIHEHYEEDFQHTDYFAAVAKSTLFQTAIDGKKEGKFTI